MTTEEFKKLTDTQMKAYKTIIKAQTKILNMLNTPEEPLDPNRFIGYHVVMSNIEDNHCILEFIERFCRLNTTDLMKDFIYECCLFERMTTIIGKCDEELLIRLRACSSYVEPFELSDVTKKLISFWTKEQPLIMSCGEYEPINGKLVELDDNLFITNMDKETLTSDKITFNNIQNWEAYYYRGKNIIPNSPKTGKGYTIKETTDHSTEPPKTTKGIIYLLRFVRDSVVFHKVGRTIQELKKRLGGYKDYTLVHNRDAINLNNTEHRIIEEFNKQCKLYSGREWFTGDEQSMVEIIDNIVEEQ